MNQWFRLYSSVVHDPKVQMLRPELFKIWINLLCLACENNGFIPAFHHVSYSLRIPPSELEKIFEELFHLELLDKKRNGAICPHHWEKFQFRSDVSTERVRAFRKRFRNVPETANETDQNRTEQIPPIVPQDRNVSPPVGGGMVAAETTYSPDFEIFWTAYPRKTGKGAAWKSWSKLRPSRTLQDRIIRAVAAARACSDWQREGGIYIPHPATWLTQRRWDDEYRTSCKTDSVHDFL